MTAFLNHITETLSHIYAEGMMKRERLISSPQAGKITAKGKSVINLCANNYLGLADHPDLIAAAINAMGSKGFGMASVRFICGTQDLHRELEKQLDRYLNKDDSILFAACFDANAGLFEPLLGPEDAIISDALNHASIIDGIRLCKARHYRYANSDMTDLDARLKEAKSDGARFIMIATDGVFSMDGTLAKLPEITKLAERYGALVMVNDCHATGFMGPKGKALGGAIGGYIVGSQPVIDLLRQRARPYLFSNCLPPSIVAAGIEAVQLFAQGVALRTQLLKTLPIGAPVRPA